MGNDTPLAVISDRPQVLFNYFRQQFAQVTNPAIDPIREELVMSLTEYIGAVGTNILTPDASNCKMVRLPQPVLTNTQLDILCNIRYKGFNTKKLPILFEIAQGDIPSLLAVSAVHHYLISVGKRVQTALIVESGEIREVMHAALLLGYGASALCPYMTFAVLDDLVKRGKIQEEYATAEKNYIKAVDKGLKKIMSKMGISTIRSYRGAKIFESIGLSEDLLRRYFGTEVTGTQRPSRSCSWLPVRATTISSRPGRSWLMRRRVLSSSVTSSALRRPPSPHLSTRWRAWRAS